MSRWVKISLYGLGLSLITALSVASLSIWWLLRDFPLESFRVLESDEVAVSSLAGKIEAGSSTVTQDLRHYTLFSHTQDSFEQWLDSMLGQQMIAKEASSLQILSDIELPKPYLNRCKQVYCLQHPISFGHIPSIFWKGLIGIEDERFLEHSGVDFRSIMRAIITDVKEMRFAQGGSTLTQQLVKNIFLSNEKKISRKLKEIIYSLYIETEFSKEEIVEGYLNEAYWGSVQGIRVKGLYAASIAYFAKKPQYITAYEASILISMLKGPGFYSPVDHLARLRQRADVIFNKLQAMGLMLEEDRAWDESHWLSWQRDLLLRHQQRYLSSIWDSVNDHNNSDTAPLDAYDRFILRRAGERLMPFLRERTKEHWKNISIKVAIGDVLSDQQYVYYSRPERLVSKALGQEKHLVGSILKPIVYSIYLDMGKKYDDRVSLLPLTMKLKSGKWSPSESHPPVETESSLIEALFHSYNRPVIRMAEELGWDEIENRLLVYLPQLMLPLKEYPAQLLGGTERSLLEVYQIYRNFVISECGKERSLENTQENTQDRNLLYKMSDPKLTTVRQVVGEDMGQLSFFGKTGTSNSGLDNWFVAFDGRFLSVVWVGHEGDRRGVKLNLYGAGTAFRIFQDFTLNRAKRFNELDCELVVKK